MHKFSIGRETLSNIECRSALLVHRSSCRRTQIPQMQTDGTAGRCYVCFGLPVRNMPNTKIAFSTVYGISTMISA